MQAGDAQANKKFLARSSEKFQAIKINFRLYVACMKKRLVTL